jgi:hypothetical protein
MRRSASVGAWTRWQAILGAFLVAAAAVAALSVPLNASWLKVAGLIVAAAGGVVALLITLARARLEGRSERAQLDRRLLVPVAPVSEVDPRLIGVDPAAQTMLTGATLPEYLPRTIDITLREAVGAAFAGWGAWLVVVVGGSKVGKSRALFEALRQCTVRGTRACLTNVSGVVPEA